MKRVGSLAAYAAAALIASAAWAQTMAPQDFVTMAASSDMLEIQSSELALQKSQNAGVKEFAQMMINDHTTASQALAAAAKQDGATVPNAMVEKHAAQFQSLNSAPSESFDASYIQAQTAAHQEAMQLMTSYAEAGEGPALKAHAAKTAPIIQMHYEHVQKLGQ